MPSSRDPPPPYQQFLPPHKPLTRHQSGSRLVGRYPATTPTSPSSLKVSSTPFMGMSEMPTSFSFGPGFGAGAHAGAHVGEQQSLLLSSSRPRSLSSSVLYHHHYYQNLPDSSVVFDDSDVFEDNEVIDGTVSGSNSVFGDGSWKSMQSSLRRIDSVSARLGLEKTNWWGIALAFLSGAFFTLSSAAVKGLRDVDPMELLVIRSSVQVLVVLPVVIKRNGCSIQTFMGPKGHRWLLQLQGLVGALTLVLLFFSFRRLPLGDATAIIFSSPVFVLILSFIFLREPCGFFRTLVVFFLITGVVLIAKPPAFFQINTQREYDVIGYICAISATLFTALNIVVMRKCKDVHFSVLVLNLSGWALLISGSLSVYFARTIGDVRLSHGWIQWVMVMFVAGCGLSGQLLVAKALTLEGAGKVAVTRSLDMVLAFLIQVFVFGEVPDWMSILGAFFVLICVMGMGMEAQLHRAASRIP